MNPFLRNIIVIGLISSSGLSACTSIQFSNYHQAVHVISEPPGAQIRHRGKLLGTTPAYVFIRRARKPVLEVSFPGQPVSSYRIPTNYRWIDSVVANVFCSVLIPLCLYSDYATGTAWEMDLELNIPVGGKAPKESARGKDVKVAIAPPTASSARQSDQVGAVLERHFRLKKADWDLRPYIETLGQFEDAHYTSYGISSGESRHRLYANLQVSHLVESSIQDEDKNAWQYTVLDIHSGQIVDRGEVHVPFEKPDAWSLTKSYLASILPNTLTMDASSKTVNLNREGKVSLYTKSEIPPGAFSEFSKFLGTFGFTNLIGPNRSADFSLDWRLISSADFTFRQFHFNGQDPSLADVSYRLVRMAGGIGPQGYMTTGIGIFYAAVMLGPSYSRVSWSGASSGATEKVSVQNIMDVGFYRYFSQRIAFRLFIRQISEDTSMWQDVMNKSENVPMKIDSIYSVESGLSLAFYIPEFGRRLRR